MPRQSHLSKNALLTLLCTLPEEAQAALLALLLRQNTAGPTPELCNLQNPPDLEQNHPTHVPPADNRNRPLIDPLRTMELPDPTEYLKLQQRVRKLETTLSSLQALLTREEWLPRRLFLERYPGISEGRLKHLLLKRKHNGLTKSGALRQSGPRSPIFICPAKFWKWFEGE